MREGKALIISAVVPAYNSAAHIGRAIDSVLAQTMPPDEILVIDDGSTDNTADIVRTYGSQVRLIEQSNAGASAARNTGILAASGDWIAFLDADDEWLPRRLILQIEMLQRYPALVWVTGNYLTCSCTEHRQAPYVQPERSRTLLAGRPVIEDYLVGCCHGLGGHTDTMFIHKSVLLEVGLFRVEQPKANDIDLWWRIAYRHPSVGYVDEPLAIYHLAVADSISKKKAGSDHYRELITRHLSLAERYNRLDNFRPLAAKLLRGWMCGMLFTAQAGDIRRLLGAFGSLFPLWYRLWMRLLTRFPTATATGCHLISKIVRRLKLRRRVVSPPPRAIGVVEH